MQSHSHRGCGQRGVVTPHNVNNVGWPCSQNETFGDCCLPVWLLYFLMKRFLFHVPKSQAHGQLITRVGWHVHKCTFCFVCIQASSTLVWLLLAGCLTADNGDTLMTNMLWCQYLWNGKTGGHWRSLEVTGGFFFVFNRQQSFVMIWRKWTEEFTRQ